ncbi:MAG TPA: response regulator transcription factor [Prolixibacteraceae bacterium]|nr:response regulator transcription factor [Prolixibacteraceae bacterium]HPR61406.1 response regulator transcription factor [Prolixibacteraceae bacterium]
MINIGLYDEHKLSLEASSKLINEIEDFEVVMLCSDRSVLKTKMKTQTVNVLLLTMHDLSAKNLNLIVQLNIAFPKTRILIVSLVSSEEMIMKAIKSGAKGFLSRESEFTDLVEAIYTLRNGHDYFSKSITQLLLNRYISNLKDDEEDKNSELSSLSARQIEILKLWGNSYSNQEIAEKLFISVRTVESHKNHIMQKLNLKSTVDLVKFGIKNNIIDI